MENKIFLFLLAFFSIATYLLLGVLDIEEDTRGSAELFQANVEARLFQATDGEIGSK